MSPGRTKLMLVGAILLLGAAGAVLFRRTAPDAAATPATQQADQQRQAPDKAVGAAKVLDRIELADSTQDGARSPQDALEHAPQATLDTAWAPEAQHSQPPAADTAGQSRFGMSSWQLEATSHRADGQPQPEFVLHTIRDGDTLPLIAQRYLGQAERFLDVFEANRQRLVHPDLLPIGLELTIPLRASTPAGRTETVMVPVQSGSIGTSTPVRPTYRVKPGDTLAGIAKQLYGNADRYQELLHANRDRLTVPSDLRQGMELIVP